MRRTTRPLLIAAIGIGAVVASLIVATPASASHARGSLVVRTDGGAVRGARTDGVDRFLGIPYAAPPVGTLRWRPPREHARWQGVRTATHYGARCTALESTNGARTDAENCLFLNVWRPTGTRAGAHLPVYVFLHGGGLVNGSSNQAGGGQFTRRTNAIVVSLNYRLGVFGFLGLPGLSARGQGNYGFLDQRFALRWVQRNIAAFGGDPRAVTLGGESAGAFSVCGHLAAPGSRGLFARAMMQSGSCESRTLDDTVADSQKFEQAAGCSTVACLRAEPAADLLDASGGFSPTLTSGTDALPVAPQTAVESGRFTRVPIVNGSNRDEGRTFTAGDIGQTEQQYVAFVRDTFGANADAVLAHYPWPKHPTAFTAAYLAGAITTDAGLAAGIGGCSVLRLDQTFARYVPTYAYEFAARRGPGLRPIPGYVWGAGHAAELAYLFPSFDNGTPIAPTFDAAERQLSRDMTQYWGAFVFDARPDAHGRTHWSRFDRTGKLLSLRPGGASRQLSTRAFRTEHQCGFWDTIPVTTG